jgi:DNA integrity scanning protein DisA with diadenylate cyclase activity
LTPIIKTLSINDSALTSILKLVAELKYFEHEREPVRASFVVIPEDLQIDPAALLFESSPGQNASKIIELLTLVQTIDGFDGATVIRANGTVLGNVMFPESDERIDRYIPRRYSAPAAASIRFDGPVFTFAGNGRASVFHRGKRVMVHRGASWHYQPSDLDRGLSALAAMNQIEADVLKEVLIVAYELSDAGRGGFITIGDADAVLQLGEPLKSSGLKWTPQLIGSIGREALLGLISRDGTTVLTSDGIVLQGMTDLRPPLGVGETEEGKGVRHATAADVSAATRAVCVTVSVAGSITVYANGVIVLKMMG